MSDVQLTNLQKATALLSVATVTIGVAGDKLAGEQVPGTGPILERIREVLNDLGAISNWLTECLLGTNPHAEVQPVATPDATPAPAGILGVQQNVDKSFHYLLNAMGVVETMDLAQIGESNVASLAMHIATMQRLQFLLKQQAEKVQP